MSLSCEGDKDDRLNDLLGVDDLPDFDIDKIERNSI